MPINWVNGGAPAVNATNLNALAVTTDVATAGTPTGDALRAAYTTVANGQRNTAFGTPQHEDGTTYTYPSRLNFGTLTPPPLTTGPANKGIDLIAHWYNDFGLEYEASSSTQANGSYVWYDWSWNAAANTGNGSTTFGYDAARHPLMGYYKGDDATVLDWQCYWMAEAGINVVSLVQTSGISSTSWTNPADKNYWIYQLLTNAPNFRAMQYIPWGKNDGTSASAIEAQNTDMVNIVNAHPGCYTYSENGHSYAVVFLWDLEAIRGIYDAFNGQSLTVAYLKGLAAKFRGIGYDGVMVMARNGGVATATPDPTLLAAGVLLVDASYEDKYGTDASYGNSYSTYATTAAFPTDPSKIVNVVTSAKTQYPHTSGWNLPGTTPALFGTVLQRAVDSIVRHGQKRMLTIYNVSEWAEGGPGLIPNKADGFGYLDAVRALAVRGGPSITPAFRQLKAFDPFDDPDGSITEAYTGQSWSNNGGTWARASGKAVCTGGTSNSWLALDVGATSYTVRAVYTRNAATSGLGLAVRVVDSANWYQITDYDGNFSITRIQAGAGTTVGGFTSPALATPTLLTAVVTPGSIVVSLNGVVKATVTETNLGTATKAGLAVSAANATNTLDNFRVN